MPKFRVKLRRVVFAEVVVEANSASAARRLIAEDPDTWFVTSDCVFQDATSVSSVEIELPVREKRLQELAKQIKTVEAIIADLERQKNPDLDRLKFLRQQRIDLDTATAVVRNAAHF